MENLKKAVMAIVEKKPQTLDDVKMILKEHNVEVEGITDGGTEESEDEVSVEVKGDKMDPSMLKEKSFDELRDMAIDKYAPEGF